MFELEDFFLELWEKSRIKDIIKAGAIGAASVVPTYYSYSYIKKKNLQKYLNWKYNDIYNPLNFTKHCWISGVQGSGKSNKLRRIFINTFVKQGWGGIYIDTHGTADLLLRSIPPNRWKDVIYIGPWLKRIFGINILQRYSNEPGEIDRIAEDVVEVFKKMYSRSWGDKLENTIRFAVKAILLAEENIEDLSNPTILDVYRLLKDPIYRAKILANIDNEVIIGALEEIKNNSAINKLENPLSSENVILFTCQKNGLNIFKAMEEKKIIICNLDKDYLSNNANLMASLIISVISQCAAKRSENKFHPYFAVAADEFYEYANKHINVLIEQMRKKNVCMLLANQHREQLPKQIQSAISMCQNKFIHTIADMDLNWVSNIYSKWYSKSKLVSIPFYSCISDIHISGKERKPKINMVAPFLPDYDWDYAHKLKFASLSFAPSRYELLKELKKQKDIKVTEDNQEIIFSGELTYE